MVFQPRSSFSPVQSCPVQFGGYFSIAVSRTETSPILVSRTFQRHFTTYPELALEVDA